MKTQRVKALITEIKRGRTKKEEIERKLDENFGKGRHLEIATAETRNKIVERIEELSKREEQFEIWEMRIEARRKRREDRRLNVFWRRNKTFPKQYGGEDETPDAEDTLMFWRNINNKDASDGWRVDESIWEVLR